MTTRNDQTTTVAELREIMRRFVRERNWEPFHNPKNLTMSLAIETGELMEHFQWLSLDAAAQIASDPQKKRAVGEEVADCLSYLLSLANALDLDLSEAMRAKMIRNAIKYPAEE